MSLDRGATGDRLRILTWHVHGNYLWYLTEVPHEFYIPFKPDTPGYGGRAGTFPWPDNLHELPAAEVPEHEFDIILFQTHRNYLHDQFELLTPKQRDLPRICIEHDPPLEHPVDQRHPVDDADVLIVHVTDFNALAWDNGSSRVKVIEHGVPVPGDVSYSGKLERGIIVVNNLRTRGRRLGADIFLDLRQDLPLDLVGMDARSLGGLGEVDPPALRAFEARYRFLFHPSRWSSLGLAVIEAMSIGMPIVALATTEMATVIENGVQGFIDTNTDRLRAGMRALLDDPARAQEMGEQARRRAQERFNIGRFVGAWNDTLRAAAGRRRRRAVLTTAYGG